MRFCVRSLLNDLQAWFSADKLLLSEGLEPEHTLSFENLVPTLGNLRWVFLAIFEVLERYELLGVRVLNYSHIFSHRD